MDIVNSATLKELAELVSGTCTGNPDLVITALNGLGEAVEGEITFVNDRKRIDLLQSSQASACIVWLDAPEISLPSIRVANPELAAARIHNYLLAHPFVARGIHPSAVIGEDCQLSGQITIGPHVCLGARVRIGSGVTLHPGVVIGDDVDIGVGTTLFANVTIYESCRIGQRVILHAGVVIGSDGFGFATDEKGQHVKRPQVGVVHIEDDVEIGANSCVDRAAFGVTRIGRGSRIDNLVQVGHNVQVGEHCILVAQVGIAGSTALGRNVVIGAKSGIAGHLKLEDGVMAAAMSGIHNNQRKGSVVGGLPAIDIKQWGRAAAAYHRLPDALKEIRRLRKEVDRLVTLAVGGKEEEERRGQQ